MEEKRGELLNKPLLKEVFLKRTNYLASKQIIKDQEIYNLIKDFFKEFLHIDYEFTREELAEELKKVYLDKNSRQKIDALFEKVFKIQYSDENLSEKELRLILSDFDKLLRMLLPTHKKKSMFQKLFKKTDTHREDLKKIIEQRMMESAAKEDMKPDPGPVEEKTAEKQSPDNEVPVEKVEKEKSEKHTEHRKSRKKPPENVDFLKDPDDKPSKKKKAVKKKRTTKKKIKKISAKPKIASTNPKEHLNELLDELEDIIDDDLPKAKEMYKEINGMYAGLDNDAKEEFFARMNGLYNRIREAHSSQGS